MTWSYLPSSVRHNLSFTISCCSVSFFFKQYFVSKVVLVFASVLQFSCVLLGVGGGIAGLFSDFVHCKAYFLLSEGGL